MKSPRPYLLRAIYDWLVDDGSTPHLLVEVTDDTVQVPRQFVKDGAIVLNISPSAVRDLQLGDEFVMFNARFGGVAQDICVPIAAVQAIYARENGRGLALAEFDDDLVDSEPEDNRAGEQTSRAADKQSDTAADGKSAPRAPHLKIVK